MAKTPVAEVTAAPRRHLLLKSAAVLAGAAAVAFIVDTLLREEGEEPVPAELPGGAGQGGSAEDDLEPDTF